jgi:transposase
MCGPFPHYQPRFTAEEIAQAREIVRQYHGSHAKVQRAKMLLVLAEDPAICTPKLASLVGVHPNTAFKWRRRWTEEGFTLEDHPRSGRPPMFSTPQVTQVKAIACQLPAQRGIPLSRFSLYEIQQEVERCALITSISTGTIWRILHQDALRPWYHQSWLFPTDPDFMYKAGRVLELYEGIWEEEPLGLQDYIISADEKSQLQILNRPLPTLPPGMRQPIRVEHTYERKGTVAYLAALDIHSGHIFGRVDESTGILPFQNLVEMVMEQEPYASADRVFWIVDNGSSHYTTTFPKRLKEAYENAIAVHLPLHASWLNQIEIYFSILQRKALTPNDLTDREAMEDRLLGFQERYNRTAKPFDWQFTRQDLEERIERIRMAA